MRGKGIKSLAEITIILLVFAVAFIMSGCPGSGGGDDTQGGSNVLPGVTVDCPASVNEDASAICTLTATAPAGTVAPLSCFVAPQSTCTGAVVNGCTSVSLPPQGESAGGGSCILAVGVQDSTSPPKFGGNFDVISINKTNQAPYFSQEPTDIYVALNSFYDHNNGIGADDDLPNAAPGDDGYLTCSVSSNCNMGIAVTGAGSGTVNCSISFASQAAPETCDATIQVSDGTNTAQKQISIHATNIWYVDANMLSSGNGTTWAEAFKTIQEGMAAASSGEQVWVKAGVYYKSASSDESVLLLKNGVAIFGGFAGTETSTDDRYILMPSTTVLDGQSNTCHVVRGYNGTTVLDGFRLTGGYSKSGMYCSNAGGGGIYNYNMDAKLNNLYIDHNYVPMVSMGGGIKNNGSNVVIGNSILGYNKASKGGGMASYRQSQVKIYNTFLLSNLAYNRGGGIYNYYGTFDSYNSYFAGNYATSGGGILSSFTTGSLLDSTFVFNGAEYDGGAVRSEYSQKNISGSAFYGNYSNQGNGGALCLFGTWTGHEPSATVSYTSLYNNTAYGNGGAIDAVNGATFNLVYNDIIGNEATWGDGGAINLYNSYVYMLSTDVSYNSSYHGRGGGLNFDLSDFEIANSTISYNKAVHNGGGISLSDGEYVYLDYSTIRDNLSYRRGGGVYSYDSYPQISKSQILNNQSEFNGGGIFNRAYYGSELTLLSSTVSGNLSYSSGGGIANEGDYSYPTRADASIWYSVIGNNICLSYGGGIYNNYAHSNIYNNVISDNTALANYGPTLGGGLANRFNSEAYVSNNVISGNSAFYGGGIGNWEDSLLVGYGDTITGNVAFVAGALNNNYSAAYVYSAILWNDMALYHPEIDNYNGLVSIMYSDIAGGYGGPGNINNDPLFANAPNVVDFTRNLSLSLDSIQVFDSSLYTAWDVIEIGNDGVARTVTAAAGGTVTFSPAVAALCYPGTPVGNWGPGATNLMENFHIAPPSPAVNSGYSGGPPFDIENNPRPSGGNKDMGAYEYQWP